MNSFLIFHEFNFTSALWIFCTDDYDAIEYEHNKIEIEIVYLWNSLICDERLTNTRGCELVVILLQFRL